MKYSHGRNGKTVNLFSHLQVSFKYYSYPLTAAEKSFCYQSYCFWSSSTKTRNWFHKRRHTFDFVETL